MIYVNLIILSKYWY